MLTHKTRSRGNGSATTPLQGRIARVAVILFLLGIAGKTVGFLQQVVVADKFGASAGLDAYIVAQSIPGFFLQIMMIGGLSAIFIPVFKELETSGESTAGWEMINSIINVLLLASLLITFMMLYVMPVLNKLFAPGFSGSRLATATRMGRELAITLPILTAASLFNGVNNMQRAYIAPAIGAVAGSGVNLILTWSLCQELNEYALVVANIAMVGTVAVITFWSAHSSGYRYKFVIHLKSKEFRRLMSGVAPIVMITLMNTLNFYSDRWFASMLPVGNVSILNYAWRFEPIIVGGVSAAIAAPLLTELSESVARRDVAQARQHMSGVIRLLSLTVFPLCILLILFSHEVVSLVYGHGAFNRGDVAQVALVLSIITVALLIWSYGAAFNQYLFATKKWKFSALITTANVTANIILDIFLVKPFGVVGLAIATTVTTAPFGVWVWKVAYKELDLKETEIGRFAGKIGVSVAGMIAVAIVSSRLVTALSADVLIRLALPVTFGVAAYLAVVSYLKIDEIYVLRNKLASILGYDAVRRD